MDLDTKRRLVQPTKKVSQCSFKGEQKEISTWLVRVILTVSVWTNIYVHNLQLAFKKNLLSKKWTNNQLNQKGP